MAYKTNIKIIWNMLSSNDLELNYKFDIGESTAILL